MPTPKAPNPPAYCFIGEKVDAGFQAEQVEVAYTKGTGGRTQIRCFYCQIECLVGITGNAFACGVEVAEAHYCPGVVQFCGLMNKLHAFVSVLQYPRAEEIFSAQVSNGHWVLLCGCCFTVFEGDFLIGFDHQALIVKVTDHILRTRMPCIGQLFQGGKGFLELIILKHCLDVLELVGNQARTKYEQGDG